MGEDGQAGLGLRLDSTGLGEATEWVKLDGDDQERCRLSNRIATDHASGDDNRDHARQRQAR